MNSESLTYNNYNYPIWATILGWMFTLSSVSAIPIVALIWWISDMKQKRNMNINCVDLKDISGIFHQIFNIKALFYRFVY